MKRMLTQVQSTDVAGEECGNSSVPPWMIGVLLVIASACYLLNSVALLMDLPLGPLDGLILIPAFLGELSFCLWLLVRGVNEECWQAVYAASVAK